MDANYNRITTDPTQSYGGYADNYGSTGVLLSGASHTWVSNAAGADGADATPAQLANQSWWETYPGWSFDDSSAWYWDSTKNLPDLRVFSSPPEITTFPLSPYGDQILAVNTSYSFTADTSYADTFLWNFGDGTTAATESATHSYSASGSYNVSLTISNDGGVTRRIIFILFLIMPI